MFACSLQPGLGAFDHQLTFHLGQGSHVVEEEASRDRGGIDRVGEADETYTAVVQTAGEVQEVFHAPAQAVQLPHHQGVALAQVIQRLVESGALGRGAADCVFVDFVASGLLQGVQLQVQVLVPGGDPGVADAVCGHGGVLFSKLDAGRWFGCTVSRTIFENQGSVAALSSLRCFPAAGLRIASLGGLSRDS